MEEEEEVEEEEEEEKDRVEECNWSLASLISVSRLSLLLPQSLMFPETPLLMLLPSVNGEKGITGMPFSIAALTSSSSSALLLDLLDLNMLIIPALEIVSVLDGRVGVDVGEQEDAATEETKEHELLLSSSPLSSEEEEEEEEEVEDKEVKSAEALTGGFLLLVTLPALRICLSSLASMDTNCWKDN